jgi:hypothetical protein
VVSQDPETDPGRKRLGTTALMDKAVILICAYLYINRRGVFFRAP